MGGSHTPVPSPHDIMQSFIISSVYQELRPFHLILVPSEAPHIEDLEIDANGCVDIKWNPISEEHYNGFLLGYRIFYYTDCVPEEDPSRHSGEVDVFAPSTYHKLCGLHPGLQYRIHVAGFTSKGAGEYNDREVFTCKC